MTSTVYVDAISGAAVVVIATLIAIIVITGMCLNYRHERWKICNRNQQKSLDQEHELLKLDADRQIRQLELDNTTLQMKKWEREQPRGINTGQDWDDNY